MKRRRLGIMGYFGHGNVGDEAMVEWWVQYFQSRDILDNVTLFTADGERTAARFGIRCASSALPLRWSQYLRGTVGRSRVEFWQAVGAFRNCNTILMGGGGILQDQPDTSAFLLDLLDRIGWARRRSMQVGLLGVGVGPLYRDESKEALAKSLDDVQLIVVRDEASLELLRSIGVHSVYIHRSADLVFSLEPAHAERTHQLGETLGLLRTNRKRVGFCLRADDLQHRRLELATAAAIASIIERYDVEVWLIPFQVGGGEDDRVGARALLRAVNRSDRCRLLSGKFRPSEWMGLFGYFDAIVGEKLHAAIFSIYNAKPTLGLSYHPKVAQLFHDVGQEEYCLDIDSITTERVLSVFDRLWTSRTAIEAHLQVVRDTLVAESRKNRTILDSFLSSSPGTTD